MHWVDGNMLSQSHSSVMKAWPSKSNRAPENIRTSNDRSGAFGEAQGPKTSAVQAVQTIRARGRTVLMPRLLLTNSQVFDRIGKGAYGCVWQAKILESRKEVVVKVVWPDADLDPEDSKDASPGNHRREAFKKEIHMMQRVGQHSNIVEFYGATSDCTVIVFEQALADLHDIIRKQKSGLKLPMVARCCKDILKGIDYLHSIGVMHRDIKPANLLMFKDMAVKICDFGLAREFSEGESRVKSEMTTLWYRAPELLMGSEIYTSRIDEWSLGCIILEMLAGACQLRGKVEDVCKCPVPTHFNYNGDQLAKVFMLVGTPRDEKLLSQMHCRNHFAAWPKYESSLESSVQKALTDGREIPEHPQGDQKYYNTKNWYEVIRSLLTLDPSHRKSSIEVLELPLFDDNLNAQEDKLVDARTMDSFARSKSLPKGMISKINKGHPLQPVRRQSTGQDPHRR
eukprot:765803-Hanusia_phi.AAC.3